MLSERDRPKDLDASLTFLNLRLIEAPSLLSPRLGSASQESPLDPGIPLLVKRFAALRRMRFGTEGGGGGGLDMAKKY